MGRSSLTPVPDHVRRRRRIVPIAAGALAFLLVAAAWHLTALAAYGATDHGGTTASRVCPRSATMAETP